MEPENSDNRDLRTKSMFGTFTLKQLWFHCIAMCILASLAESLSIFKSIPYGFNIQKDDISPYLENSGWFYYVPLIICYIFASEIAEFYIKKPILRLLVPPILVMIAMGFLRAFFIIVLLKYFN